jgi:hypothetical protein
MVEVPSILIRSVNCAIAATWPKRHIQFAAPCRRFADHRRIRIEFGCTVCMRGEHLLRQPIKSGDNRDSSCFGPRQHFADRPTENPFLVAFGQVICAAYAEEGVRIGMVIGGNREITRPHQALDAEGVDNPS